jgi:hypothetical protein
LKLLAFLGLMFILLGLTLIILTYLINYSSKISFENLRLPKFLIYIYEKNGLTFITSPILIIIGLGYFLWVFLKIFHK